MNQQRLPSVPLITCDPYFSVWSPADTLYGADTCHWTGAVKPIRGIASVDGADLVFMGAQDLPRMTQTGLDVTPTSARYTFEGAGIELTAAFTTPLLLTDLDLVSRPCSYIDFTARSLDGADHRVKIALCFDGKLCYDGEEPQALMGGEHRLRHGACAWMGKAKQSPLCHSGDTITIDWGRLYVALESKTPGRAAFMKDRVVVELPLEAGETPASAGLVAGYDDIASIVYFGDICKGYWARGGKTILQALDEALAEHRGLLHRCAAFDSHLIGEAGRAGGEDYVRIVSAAYRQAIAAHKLIADRAGDAVFLSKECNSNGCIGTADVSYPSVPLFLLFAPELVKGMMRPIFQFARTDVWEYDFAPHDVGRYPYADGQVYGLRKGACEASAAEGGVFPPFYLYPAGSDVYEIESQMPVEECGNMLVMAAAVARAEGNSAFAHDYMDLLERWTGYLLEFGADPGEQLCTDDFAGHLAHNVNLAAKAIMGIESYAILLGYEGRGEEASWYHGQARRMAAGWERAADCGSHTSLVFGDEKGWSLKYNLVWDRLFGSRLFSDKLFETETRWYLARQNEFGTPLDSRAAYTKSDWILWAAAMAPGAEQMREMIAPVARFLARAPKRTPFSDWFDTNTAAEQAFHNRSVQGGLFMPLLRDRLCNR